MVIIMKTKRILRGILMMGIVAIIATGCITSVHPLFTNKELIFRPELIGAWQDGDETMVFRGIDSTHYSILDINKTDTTRLIGRLGKLGGHYFLDMTIDPDEKKVNDLLGAYIFPVHIFFKVSLGDNQLNMDAFAFSSDWLEKLIQEKRIRIKHEVENKQVLLTASTEELQKFVIKYADEPKAFEDNPSVFNRITVP